jgi:hypothetical protein
MVAANLINDASPLLLRHYLSLVYPTAPFLHPHAVPDHVVHSVFASRWWLYNLDNISSDSGARTNHHRLFLDGLILPPGWRCDDGFHRSLFLRSHDAMFPGLHPCTSDLHCLQRHAAFRPAWAVAVETAPPASNHLEGWHLAFNSKGREQRPKHWAEFVDTGGLSPFWWRYAPGSGIFVHVGRTLVRPGKNAMLSGLLEEFCALHGHRSLDAVLARVPNTARVGTNLCFSVLPRLQLTANGSMTCTAAGLRPCIRSDLVLSDEWDADLIGLGRFLGFDTLLFTASLSSDATCAQMAEFVDLRTYAEARTGGSDAEGMVRSLARSGHISLRNPLDVSDASAARACNFSDDGPTLRLACKGHVSWAVRDEPRRQMSCTRSPTPVLPSAAPASVPESPSPAPLPSAREQGQASCPTPGAISSDITLVGAAAPFEPAIWDCGLGSRDCPSGSSCKDNKYNATIAARRMASWLARLHARASTHDPALRAYVTEVYGAATPLHSLHIPALGFLWASVPERHAIVGHWQCPWQSEEEATRPLPSLYASLIEAQYSPFLLAPSAAHLGISVDVCGRAGSAAPSIAVARCERERLLKPAFNASRLQSPGLFVHTAAMQETPPEHAPEPIPDHSWVEVMRVARMDFKGGAENQCTRGQVWMWHAVGSGIWWPTGRSLRLPDVAPGKDCRAARRAGYDSIQLLRSNGMRLPVELVDCRGASLDGASATWESACPPPHVPLRAGLRVGGTHALNKHVQGRDALGTALPFSPAFRQVDNHSLYSLGCSCSCDARLAHINCAAGAEPL